MAQRQQIRFETDSGCLATLVDNQQQPPVKLGAAGRTHELYFFSGFYVETFNTSQKRTTLISKLPGIEMAVAFSSTISSVLVETASETQILKNIRTFHIGKDGRIPAAQTQPPQSNVQQPPMPVDRQADSNVKTQMIAQLNGEIEEYRRKYSVLQDKQRDLEHQNMELGRKNRLLETENKTLADDKKQLELDQKTLSDDKKRLENENCILIRKLDAQETDLENEVESMELSLKNKLEKLEKLNRRKREIQQKTESIRNEMDGICGMLEDMEANLEPAKRRLENLKAQLEADTETYTLIQQEPHLKGKSIRHILDEAQSKIDQAEHRMGMIIALRERINDKLKNVILNGDGTVSATEELGGDQHGVRICTETEN